MGTGVEQAKDDDVGDGEAAQEGCTIFLKNLSFSTNEAGLKRCVEKAGVAVRSVSIPRRKGKGQGEAMLSSGIGFVECAEAGSVDKALKVRADHRPPGGLLPCLCSFWLLHSGSLCVSQLKLSNAPEPPP